MFSYGKQLLMKLFFRKSTNLCKSILGIDPSKIYTYSMCQPMPTGLYTRWDCDSETIRFTPPENRSVALNLWPFHFSNEEDLVVKLRASTLKADRKKLTISVLIGFVCIAILCLNQRVAFTAPVPVKSCVLLSPKRKFDVVARRELDALRRH